MNKINIAKFTVVIAITTLISLHAYHPAYSSTESVTSTTVTKTSNNVDSTQNNDNSLTKKTITTTKTSTITTSNNSDEKIEAAIYAQYAKEAALTGTNLTVICKDGYVTISGSVTAQSQEDQAVIAAKKIPDVKGVSSKISVLTNPDNKNTPNPANY